MIDSYGNRNKILKSLGYDSYREYLESTLWEWIRGRGFAFHGRICRLCGMTATELHHLGYGRAVLTGKSLRQLVPLCRDCHQQIEYTPSGRKRSVLEVHRAFISRWRRVKNAPFNRSIGRCTKCGRKARKGSNLCRNCEKGSG